MSKRKLVLTAKIPKDSRYPKVLNTIGDHLRAVRLERKLEIKEVAQILGVSKSSIIDWEHNRKTPSYALQKDIFTFLGYLPPEVVEEQKIIEKFESFRVIKGFTIFYCADQMHMCSKQLKKLVNHDMQLSDLNRKRIQKFMQSYTNSSSY